MDNVLCVGVSNGIEELGEYIAGSGAERYVALCKASPGIQLIKDVYPNAADMGKIAYEKFIQKAWANTAYVEPLYLNALSKSVHKTPLQK